MGGAGSGAGAASPRAAGPGAEALLATAVDRLKLTTRQYVKKQESWIRNRFELRGVPMLDLDTSAAVAPGAPADSWERIVAGPALECARDLVAHGAPPIVWAPLAAATLGRGVFKCERCGGRPIRGRKEYDIHLKSKAHRRKRTPEEHAAMIAMWRASRSAAEERAGGARPMEAAATIGGVDGGARVAGEGVPAPGAAVRGLPGAASDERPAATVVPR